MINIITDVDRDSKNREIKSSRNQFVKHVSVSYRLVAFGFGVGFESVEDEEQVSIAITAV